MNALIVADGDIPTRGDVERLLRGAPPDLIVAADGGALKAVDLGLLPHVVVGDADSLSMESAEQMRRDGAEVVVHPAAKDESDTELAVGEAVRRGATRLLVIGAFGGQRLEHSLANVLLLCLPDLRGADARLADGASEVRLLDGEGRMTIEGQPGDYVSLLSLAPVTSGVTTEGLSYPLNDEPLTQGPARGLSNVMAGPVASVSARAGRLLVVHTRGDR